MTTDTSSEFRSAATALRGSLPTDETAFTNPKSGWVAQRIVSAAAALEGMTTSGSLDSPPPELPEGYPNLGPAWATAAVQWRDIAYQLAPLAVDDAGGVIDSELAELIRRLTEYAVSQGAPLTLQ